MDGRSSPPCIIFLGFNLTFFPQFILGYMGMPRRYHAYPDEFQVLHVLSSAGASVLAIGYVLPAIYFAGRLNMDPWPGAILGARPVSSGRPLLRRPRITSTRSRL